VFCPWNELLSADDLVLLANSDDLLVEKIRMWKAILDETKIDGEYGKD